MAKININNLYHFDRIEEKEILNYVSAKTKQMHIALFGFSGVGKTETIMTSLRLMLNDERYKHHTLLHYDAAQITEDCTNDLFYSLIIYRLLQKSIPSDVNLTRITKSHTFLTFLDNSAHKEEVKLNTKKALIASLSLLPTIGNLIYDILKVSDKDIKQKYQTVQYIFREYVNYLSKSTGLIIYLDNIQRIPMDIFTEFCEIVRQSDGELILFTSYTLKENELLTKKLAEQYTLHTDSLVLRIEHVSEEMFDTICEENLDQKAYYHLRERLHFYYTIVQYGNMREIDELIFQINQSGFENLTDTPTLQGIRALDEIKKDIVDLASLFPEGIRISLIKRILKYNEGCSESQFKQSISNLCKLNYIRIGDNDTLRIQHEKIVCSSKQNLESALEEERFIELMHACEKTFTETVHETTDNSEFVFCVNGLLELEKEINLVKHLGILEKYINILHESFRYSQVCNLYNNLAKTTAYGKQITMILPLRSIIQILDSFQKTSDFHKGLAISQELSTFYNMDLFRAKFLLQSYDYEGAISVINHCLFSYESWSIYLNALQHLRKDSEVRSNVSKLIANSSQYPDEEYYYIILRNSGHLFDFETAYANLSMALDYFKNVNNTFVESTCLNNLGILYLFKEHNHDNINAARSYFKQARKIMHQLKSNEEYQSIINIGTSYFCEGCYDLALDFFENAARILPESLTFDNIKLKNNISICKYALKQCLIDITREDLLSLYTEAEDLPDPWIKLLCKFNIGILSTDSNTYINQMEKDYPGETDKYGLIVKNQDIGDFMLGISPHWRY